MSTRGLVTVEMEAAHRKATGEQLHVFVDGNDVTRRCMRADDRAGYAIVLCRDPQHHDPRVQHGPAHRHPTYGILCIHRLDGDTVIQPGGAR